MAKLDSTPYPGDWGFRSGEDVETYLKRMEELDKTVPWENVLRFSVADGQAYYFVKSKKPLVLQHIPKLDAYTIHPAMIRGLTLVEVERQLAFQNKLDKLFNK